MCILYMCLCVHVYMYIICILIARGFIIISNGCNLISPRSTRSDYNNKFKKNVFIFTARELIGYVCCPNDN